MCAWLGHVLPLARSTGRTGTGDTGRRQRGQVMRRRIISRRRARADAVASAASDNAQDNPCAWLEAIALDVQREAGAAADSVRAEFAIRMFEVTRRTPRHAIASAMNALREAQRAALAAIAAHAASETRARQNAAKGCRKKSVQGFAR